MRSSKYLSNMFKTAQHIMEDAVRNSMQSVWISARVVEGSALRLGGVEKRQKVLCETVFENVHDKTATVELQFTPVTFLTEGYVIDVLPAIKTFPIQEIAPGGHWNTEIPMFANVYCNGALVHRFAIWTNVTITFRGRSCLSTFAEDLRLEEEYFHR